MTIIGWKISILNFILGFFAQLAVRSATLLPLTQYYLLPSEIIL
jgi:hypothetical protein